jgi:3-hydroxyisobutyrate dehydrogenase-like beta-hydroxyacid dehydrogenase
MTILLLHPGEMGAAIAGCLVRNGTPVIYASEGRSAASRARAEGEGIQDAGTLQVALRKADAVLSICVPSGAHELAAQVAAHNFRGIYIDANAIAPDSSREIGRIVEAAGATFVDGGIVGLPPTATRITRLYLCGPEAGTIAKLFANTQTEAKVMDASIGAASALKVCFAAWSKGETALLAVIRALAHHEGVDETLMNEWRDSMPEVPAQSEHIVQRAWKAWRWVGEMEEIAASFEAAGLPSGFLANAEIYRRLADLKDPADLKHQRPTPTREEINARLLHRSSVATQPSAPATQPITPGVSAGKTS